LRQAAKGFDSLLKKPSCFPHDAVKSTISVYLTYPWPSGHTSNLARSRQRTLGPVSA